MVKTESGKEGRGSGGEGCKLKYRDLRRLL